MSARDMLAKLAEIRFHAGDIFERGNRMGALPDDAALEILTIVRDMEAQLSAAKDGAS